MIRRINMKCLVSGKLSGIYKMRFRFMKKFGSKLYRIYGYDIESI